MMYERIAVPLDGSSTALRAIGPAKRLAAAHGATVVLVTVATGSDVRAENVLAAGCARAGDGVDTLVLHGSDAATELGRYDADDPATLLCLTTQGRGALRRVVFGSTALAVVRHSPYAVMVIGPHCRESLESPITPIVTCLDGTDASESVLPWVTRWCRTTDASLILVHVVYPRVVGATATSTADQMGELTYLATVRKRLQGEVPRVHHVTLQRDDPAAALRDVGDRYPDGMYALATSHPGRLKDILEGSTAATVIRTSAVPVLVVSEGDVQHRR
jgi:nucleotide-binding universal stress UspA family protein